jgi:predicted phage tail component-like protein
MIKLNNIDIPSFVKVTDIKQSVLPPVSQKTVKVNGRAGEIDFGNEIGSREIEVEFTILGANTTDLRGKVRQLAQWLYYEEPKPLVINEEPDKFYMAKVTGDSELDDIVRYGQGSIVFYCADPYAYSTNEKEIALNQTLPEDPAIVENAGAVETFPKYRFEFTQPTTEFTVISDDKFMRFGKPASVDDTPVDVNPLVFADDMTTVTGWTTATTVDGGVVAGNFRSNGYSFSLENAGEGSAWHGASGVKALSRSVQDFKAQIRMSLLTSAVGQLGRVELYLRDANGAVIGKIALRNGNPNGRTPYAQVRLGSNYILETYGDYAGVWKDWSYGTMDIARRGNVWSIYYSIIDNETGVHHTRLYKEFIDKDGLYSAPLGQVQIHMGLHGTAPAPASMYISDVKVWEENIVPASNEVPYIFKTGDILEIDTETDAVLLNGEPYYEALDPSSQFITLKKGTNGIMLSPIVTDNNSIKFKERWL